jgi:hypothetical protein
MTHVLFSFQERGMLSSPVLSALLPWGNLFQKWFKAGIILPPVRESSSRVIVKTGPSLNEKKIPCSNFNEEDFRTLQQNSGFSFYYNGDRDRACEHYRFGFYEIKSNGQSSIGFKAPDLEIGKVSPVQAEDIWCWALECLKVRKVVTFSAGSPISTSPYSGADPLSPIVSGYHWLQFLRPDVVERLGGAEAVLRDAPVERKQLVFTAEGAQGVLCRVAPSPHLGSDDDWRNWKEFLTPVLGVFQTGDYTGISLSRLTPEDRALLPTANHTF